MENSIPLRDRLNISPFITFGFEIEFDSNQENSYESIYNLIKDNEDYYIKHESTTKNGGEVTSMPLSDCKETWEELKEICKIIQKYGYANERTAGHIHIGFQIFNNKKQFLNFLKLWAAYEHVIYHFGYGEFENARIYIPTYARSLKETINLFFLNTENLNKPIKSFEDKYWAFTTRKFKKFDKYINYNTLEFRMFNGTLDPVIWQNNLNFIVNLIKYAKSENFNEKFIDKKRQNTYFYEKDFYSKIFIEDAVELADLIFDNEKDKDYFYIQYLKSYQEIKKRSLIKTRKFTSY